MNLRVRRSHTLRGRIAVPGDKSISHRALILGALAEGETRVRGFLPGGDPLATVNNLRRLGVEIEELAPDRVIVHGRGLEGLHEPEEVLDCVNSGTTMRLLAGVLAGLPFTSVLTGSAQLRRRPVGRITTPLRQMGATVLGRDKGRLPPVAIAGGNLRGIEYELPVPSAQTKSAVLLAGLSADGLTVVREPGPARDHTERMLRAMGAPIEVMGHIITSERPNRPLTPLDVTIPGDISSASFLIVAAVLAPDSDLTIESVGVNPTRTGLLDVLRRMGADIELSNEREVSGEPVADLRVRTSDLQAGSVSGDDVVRMIDEFPVLAVAATQAQGVTEVRDASELRVKETDRIATTVTELRRLGALIEERPDGFVIEGPTPLYGTHVESHGDHRLAMALTIAGLVAAHETLVMDADCIADSFPGFEKLLIRIGAHLE
ncbi:MAG TPA: 3-phosphoshikimate 1-carboxyvinyltransferase [Anaerolineae bacterium]|nr:3-phosphoshikimate 1-carboxyvinyltransferase [Anaerolineae bacterium]